MFAPAVFAVGVVGVAIWLWFAYEFRAWAYVWLFSLPLPLWLSVTAAIDMSWQPSPLWQFVGDANMSTLVAAPVLVGLFLLMCGFSRRLPSNHAMKRFVRLSPAIMVSCALALALHALQTPAVGLDPVAALPHVVGGAYGTFMLWLWGRRFNQISS